MTQIPTVKPLALIKFLKHSGFTEIRQVGSHKFFKHVDGRTTVIPFHRNDIGRGLLRSILRDIKLTPKEFVRQF